MVRYISIVNSVFNLIKRFSFYNLIRIRFDYAHTCHRSAFKQSNQIRIKSFADRLITYIIVRCIRFTIVLNLWSFIQNFSIGRMIYKNDLIRTLLL